MTALEQFNIAVVGACGRGKSFKTACDALEVVNIRAVCDINEQELPAAQERFGANEAWSDYSEMLEKCDLDAVILGTPMQFHVPQALEALAKDKHVLSEVPAAVSIEECEQLVAACKTIRGIGDQTKFAHIHAYSHNANLMLIGQSAVMTPDASAITDRASQ